MSGLKNAAGGPEDIKMCQDAATALHAQAENEKLRGRVGTGEAKIEIVENQRDSAIKELENYMARCFRRKCRAQFVRKHPIRHANIAIRGGGQKEDWNMKITIDMENLVKVLSRNPQKSIIKTPSSRAIMDAKVDSIFAKLRELLTIRLLDMSTTILKQQRSITGGG